MNTLDFLRLILPLDGLKATFLLPAKRHVFTNSIEELADIIQYQDSQGVTTYHACAAFAQGSVNRWAANAVGAKALWIDVDAGEGKPYPNAKDAAMALGAFATRAGIPIPLMVASGSGIHGYWPLKELLPKGEWHLYATGLKALAEEYGLQADPTRTADIASILRTPGTHNRKSGQAVPVRVIFENGPFDLSQLAVLAGKGRPERVRVPKIVDPLTASLMNVQSYPDAHAEVMADGCAVIGHLRDSHGAVSEPVWHALVGALAFAVDGEEKAQEWASGGYEGEIALKFERARALTGPTSCEAIQAVNGTTMCRGCPFFNQGRNPTMIRPMPQNAPQSPQAAPPDATDDPGDDEEPDRPWCLPEGFRIEENSLVLSVPTPEGAVDVTVCEHAVVLTGTARAEVAEDKYSYVFHRYDPRGNVYREFTVPAKTIMSSGGLAEIAGRGASVQLPDKFMQYLRAAVPMVQSSDNEMIKYEQFGWKGDDFLLGSRLYCQGGAVEQTVGSPDIEVKSHLLTPRSGNLSNWTKAANRLFVHGSEAQSLCMLASFAAPLMKFQSADEGGAVLSLIGKSGTGKSTTLAGAASVWGRDKGVTIKNDDTYNAKFISLGLLCNLPIIYDEVHQTDPELIKRLIVTFTNGSDRARGTTDGSLVARSNSWQTLMLTGSNPSMVEIIGSLPGSDAAGKRIFELVMSMPAGTDHKTGDELKRTFEANAGWAGEAYIKSLMEPGMLAYIKQALAKYTADIWTATKLPSEYRFWVRTMGAIAVAALLVNKLGLIEFSPQRIITWAMKEMKEQALGQLGSSMTPAEMVSSFLNEHLADTLVVQKEWKQRQTDNAVLKTPTRQLVVRYETEAKHIIIDETRLRKWVLTNGGGNYREALDELKRAGIAKRGNWKRSLGAGTMMPTGQVPVVVIDGTLPEFSGIVMEFEREESNVVPLRSR